MGYKEGYGTHFHFVWCVSQRLFVRISEIMEHIRKPGKEVGCSMICAPYLIFSILTYTNINQGEWKRGSIEYRLVSRTCRYDIRHTIWSLWLGFQGKLKMSVLSFAHLKYKKASAAQSVEGPSSRAIVVGKVLDEVNSFANLKAKKKNQVAVVQEVKVTKAQGP